MTIAFESETTLLDYPVNIGVEGEIELVADD